MEQHILIATSTGWRPPAAASGKSDPRAAELPRGRVRQRLAEIDGLKRRLAGGGALLPAQAAKVAREGALRA
eukprot:10600315-Lingulodinium_polyedra.AAC.1